MQIGDTLAINLATAYHVVAGRIISRSCMADIIEVTEKAVKVEAATDNGKMVSAWFPKKALVAATNSMSNGTFIHGNHALHCVTLAPWFKAAGWTGIFLNIAGAC